VTLYHPGGCSECRQTGYRGRAAIAEFLELGSDLERLIISGADHATIERAAVAAGMEVMLDAGIAAALAGETTIEEVARSVQAEG
jgi:general secretion pathway protein E